LGDHLSITDLAAPIEDNRLDVSAMEPDFVDAVFCAQSTQGASYE
jgi:hypothetical protein